MLCATTQQHQPHLSTHIKSTNPIIPHLNSTKYYSASALDPNDSKLPYNVNSSTVANPAGTFGFFLCYIIFACFYSTLVLFNWHLYIYSQAWAISALQFISCVYFFICFNRVFCLRWMISQPVIKEGYFKTKPVLLMYSSFQPWTPALRSL